MIHSLRDAAQLRERVAGRRNRRTFVMVDGARGAGKTTFVQSLGLGQTYKTFERDPGKVPGLMTRGVLDIGQAQIFTLDALDQILEPGQLVVFDRSVLSTWACAVATCHVDPTDAHMAAVDRTAGYLDEYARLLRRLTERSLVIHVVISASLTTLAGVAAERSSWDPRPVTPLLHEQHLFPYGLEHHIPDCCERYLMERV